MQRISGPSAPGLVRAFLTIHSAPSALRQHIDWALANILGSELQVKWQTQPMMVGTYKMHIQWRGQQGAAAEIASALRSWHYLNFEVHESNDNGGELFRFTPELGIHRVLTDLSGAVLLNEHQINSVLQHCVDEDAIRDGLALAMGSAWDEALEKFRSAGMQEVACLHAI